MPAFYRIENIACGGECLSRLENRTWQTNPSSVLLPSVPQASQRYAIMDPVIMQEFDCNTNACLIFGGRRDINASHMILMNPGSYD